MDGLDPTNGKPLPTDYEVDFALKKLINAKRRTVHKSETEIAIEIEQQVYSWLDLCAMYEDTPTIRKFINFLDESYE